MLKGNLRSSVVIALACGFVLGAVQEASAQNRLLNPGFEAISDDGGGPKPDDWGNFNHVYAVLDDDNGLALSGLRKLKMFGPWAGAWNASGSFQDHPAYPGDVWTLGVNYMVSSIDPMQGGNLAIIKMEWYDAGGARLCGGEWEGYPPGAGCPEKTVATSATGLDEWRYDELQAASFPGTASVKALLLHVQPDGAAGGSINYDEASFVLKSREIPTVSEWGLVVMTLVGLAGGTMLFRRLSVV